eukprot:6213251-Pleurochrysis_carterae.AAC.2
MNSTSSGSNKMLHEVVMESMLKPENIMAVVCGKHKCSNIIEDGGQQVPCNHQLWAITITPDAVNALTRHRTRFLAQSTRKRGEMAAEGIHFPPRHTPS